MKKLKISNETLVGAFVAIAITLLILGFNFLKGKNLFKKNTIVYAQYPETNGLSKSNKVVYNGLRIGTVNRLFLDDKNRITVELEIDEKILVPKNSTAKIISSDLLGTKAVQIIYNTKETAIIANGDTLIGSNEQSLEDQISEQVLPVKLKVDNLLGSLDTLTLQLQYIFRKESIDKSLKVFQQSLENVNRTTATIDGFVTDETNQLAIILSNLKAITDSVKTYNSAITRTLNNVAAISDTLVQAELIKNLSQTLVNTKVSLKNFEIITNRIVNAQGSMGLLINDPSLYNELKQTNRSLDSLLKEVNAYPSFLIFNKEKRKKEKNNRKEK